MNKLIIAVGIVLGLASCSQPTEAERASNGYIGRHVGEISFNSDLYHVKDGGNECYVIIAGSKRTPSISCRFEKR